MVDFHSHILQEVDDGSRSLDESITLLREAEKVGFDKIILTSHYMEDYYRKNVLEREGAISNLKETAKRMNIKLDLHIGSEIFLTGNIVELLKNSEASTISNTSYVLFELPFNIEPINLMDIIYELKHNKLIPVLAHPERYQYFFDKPEIYSDLVEKGVMLQANYGSFIGKYGSKEQLVAKKLLKCNLIHFLGSDVHRPNSIYPKMSEILDIITDIAGEEKTYQLTDVNPNLVLENKKIEIEDFECIKWNFKEKIKLKMGK